MRPIGKLTTIAGFSLVVVPSLLAANDLLDNTTFTVLFIIGLVLIIVSNLARTRSSKIIERIQ